MSSLNEKQKTYTVGDLKKNLELLPDDTEVLFNTKQYCYTATEKNFVWDAVDGFYIDLEPDE